MKFLRKYVESGKPIIVLDEEREMEADFVFPAEKIDEKVLNFMVTYGKGLLCLTADEKDLLNRCFFKLPSNSSTNYYVPIDYGNGTGISIDERVETCRKFSEGLLLSCFKYPGHIFVLGGKGLNNRKGHTEASLELMEILGFKRYSVIIEILDSSGNSHNFNYIREISKKYDIPLTTIKDIWIEYVKSKQIMRVSTKAKLPTKYGDFKIVGFEGQIDGKEHFAILKEPLESPVYVRVHSECVTGDILGSLRCDCGDQLKNSLKFIAKKSGVVLYLRQEGRGIGLTNKVKAYNLQDRGYDTVEANIMLGFSEDERDFAVAAQMLKALGISEIILFSNNPFKKSELEKYGIKISGVKRIFGKVTEFNRNYLLTKKIKMKHEMDELFQNILK